MSQRLHLGATRSAGIAIYAGAPDLRPHLGIAAKRDLNLAFRVYTYLSESLEARTSIYKCHNSLYFVIKFSKAHWHTIYDLINKYNWTVAR